MRAENLTRFRATHGKGTKTSGSTTGREQEGTGLTTQHFPSAAPILIAIISTFIRSNSKVYAIGTPPVLFLYSCVNKSAQYVACPCGLIPVLPEPERCISTHSLFYENPSGLHVACPCISILLLPEPKLFCFMGLIKCFEGWGHLNDFSFVVTAWCLSLPPPQHGCKKPSYLLVPSCRQMGKFRDAFTYLYWWVCSFRDVQLSLQP